MGTYKRINVSSGRPLKPLANYSRALRCGDMVLQSGTTAIDTNGDIIGENDIATQVDAINAFRDRVVLRQATAQGLAQIADAAARRASGGFLHSCVNHVGGDNAAAWAGYAIGGVAMRDAVAAWHTVHVSTRVARGAMLLSSTQATTHIDCRRVSGAAPPLCNPTCNVTGPA